jgi:acyl-coenzyme A synthetase/AMP-(fatty) acid ligase
MHFDLSVLDVYVPMKTGGSVALVAEGTSLMPRSVTEFIREQEITVWYSVPSALIMMMNDGDFLTRPPPSLRAVLFAGEPFPMQHLKRLREGMPRARLLNLYGPTETNVCTFHEARELPSAETLPIGRACSGDRVWAEKASGELAAVGEEGELVVDGPTVHLGYWGQPPHRGPYRTGDIVRVVEEGTYSYVGRKDQMAKVRGHRVEPGEIEAALDSHRGVDQVAVVITGSGLDAKIIAFVVSKGDRPSLIELKRHCSKLLPRHMIVDDVNYVAELPRTSTGKVDRIRLQTLLAG